MENKRIKKKYGVKVLNEFQQEFIRKNHKVMTVAEFCDLFNKKYDVVSQFMSREGIERKPMARNTMTKKAAPEEKPKLDRSAWTTYSNKQYV
ncbi:MAG: hypothetical protein ACTHMM_05510 [Agriterribacter sp.]